MGNKNKLISIVIPCFNEEAVIQLTIDRLNLFRKKLERLDIEFIFVDDGSQDTTFEQLKTNAKIYKNFKVISFSRNFGHQIAVTAGITAASGDAVVLIDADLQDPPEVIHKMIKLWKEGFQVVYGTRIKRDGESYFKTLSAKWFYKCLNYLSEVSIPIDSGDFRLMDRVVVEVLKTMPERDRFIRGMVSWVGYKQISVEYKRDARIAGISKYPLKKMIKFAVDGILSFSTKPLQLSITLGFTCSSLALAGIAYALFLRLFTNIWVPGWTAIMIAVLFIGGVQLICLGILGGYIGRIYNEMKNRPLYVINEKVNLN
jgi:glycosyltransferase involved in cell wall biosynthesis